MNKRIWNRYALGQIQRQCLGRCAHPASIVGKPTSSNLDSISRVLLCTERWGTCPNLRLKSKSWDVVNVLPGPRSRQGLVPRPSFCGNQETEVETETAKLSTQTWRLARKLTSENDCKVFMTQCLSKVLSMTSDICSHRISHSSRWSDARGDDR